MRKFAWLFVLLLIAGCGGGGEEQAATTEETAADPDAGQSQEAVATAEAAPVELAIRPVACGCSIESVGSCGNYVKIGDDFVEIANSADLGLGSMEWCGKEGVTAETAGELKEGKFFASTLVAKTSGH